MKLADNKATLSFSNGSPSIEMPVYSGNIGPDEIGRASCRERV